MDCDERTCAASSGRKSVPNAGTISNPAAAAYHSSDRSSRWDHTHLTVFSLSEKNCEPSLTDMDSKIVATSDGNKRPTLQALLTLSCEKNSTTTCVAAAGEMA